MLSMLLLVALLPLYVSAMETKADKQGLTFVFTNKKSSESIRLEAEHLNALPGLKAFYKDSPQHTIENPKHITYEFLTVTKKIVESISPLKKTNKDSINDLTKSILSDTKGLKYCDYINFLDMYGADDALLSNALIVSVDKEEKLSLLNDNLQARAKNLLNIKKGVRKNFIQVQENSINDLPKEAIDLSDTACILKKEGCNLLTDFPCSRKFANLSHISLVNALIGCIPSGTWPHLKELDLRVTLIREINADFAAPCLKSLNLTGCKYLKKIEAKFPKIENFSCTRSALKNVTFLDNSPLKKLYIMHSKIKTLQKIKLPSLEYLEINGDLKTDVRKSLFYKNRKLKIKRSTKMYAKGYKTIRPNEIKK